jgi:hypothetical protein
MLDTCGNGGYKFVQQQETWQFWRVSQPRYGTYDDFTKQKMCAAFRTNMGIEPKRVTVSPTIKGI